tara:strand:+ start:96 stop:761 length:666 start_codon:yes stop_codon:yes gene_type:complete
MKKLKNFVTSLHQQTKRNFLGRMNDNKVFCMEISKKYGSQYWDGNRRFGYGGYKYIPGRSAKVAKKIIKTYKLNNNSSILDIGCGKGYLLYEIKKILPNIKILGIDKSGYAIRNSKPEIKKFLKKKSAEKKTSFTDKSFDLVISLGCLHNLKLFELETALKEINRISKRSYIMVESFRTNRELFNLQCWALTCETFLSPNDWKWLFNKLNYNGDYEFIYFK